MNVCLFDDEPLALTFLERKLAKLKYINILFKSTKPSIEDKKKLLAEADLVFLDIEMRKVNGLVLAEKILQVNPSINIVFVTAHDQYAIEAFELNALDYILKPVSPERLENTIQRIETLPSTLNKTKSDSTSPLRINVLGDFKVHYSHSYSFEKITWRTSKSKELFLYLLQHEGKTVLKSQIIDVLWGQHNLKKAYSNLYMSIYNIRKTFGSFQNYIVVSNVHEGYLLELKNVILDKNEWKRKLEAAPSITNSTLEIYEDIMSLYSGSYLVTNDYIWLENERFELEELWLHRARLIANCYMETNDLEKAVHWYLKILEIRPEDEQISFSLMKTYASLNYRMFVDYQYQQLSKSLSNMNLEIDPVISDWYSRWKQQY
ncbi:response regulator [Halalkalibacter sp. APA_J-10(15)]|uniref:response regulator n=1 Tax=Halalkalibacter sp. APA_J-10(15) TaxID=2933805 RepID=UPI001FF68C57|nr:response regulator [Halalkalibacter sp. APA_J-10(15)]MCK0470183.1 response regulator [Halalkalibacter sp. APA_J-10(15)]